MNRILRALECHQQGMDAYPDTTINPFEPGGFEALSWDEGWWRACQLHEKAIDAKHRSKRTFISMDHILGNGK